MTWVWINSTADWFRLANIVLAASYVVATLVLARRRLGLSRRSDMLHQMAIAALASAILVGSAETLASDTPAPGVHTYLFTLGLSWAHLAEWARWRDHCKNPPTRKGTHP